MIQQLSMLQFTKAMQSKKKRRKNLLVSTLLRATVRWDRTATIVTLLNKWRLNKKSLSKRKLLSTLNKKRVLDVGVRIQKTPASGKAFVDGAKELLTWRVSVMTRKLANQEQTWLWLTALVLKP